MRILACIPIKPSLNPQLREICCSLASLLAVENPKHDIGVFFDYTPVAKLPTDSRAWSRVARARNRLLDRITIKEWDYLLWIDADVVKYPLNMPTKLIDGNPDGVSAPMVFVEDTSRFYDWAAFVMKGKDNISPESNKNIRGRNLHDQPPYWHEYVNKFNLLKLKMEADPLWYQPNETIVEMDCVGTITMVPTWVYQYARYEDHPAFTDHYPICKACRDHGKKVTVDRSIIAYHADLPKYGETWH